MKTIIRSILILTLLIGSISLNAQEEKKTNLHFKLFLNSQNKDILSSIINREQHNNEVSEFGQVSIGLEWDRNSPFSHEITWQPFSIRNETDYYLIDENDLIQVYSGSKQSAYKTALRYQLNYTIKTNSRWNPYIGISTQAWFNHSVYKPTTSINYKTKKSLLDFIIAFNPGIKYSVSEKLFLETTCSVGLFIHSIDHINFENPGMPIDLRKQDYTETKYFPLSLDWRIGIGYNF